MADNFYQTLKKLREKADHTQQEMADTLKISIKQYQNYEKKTWPPHDKLKKINRILNTDLSPLIYQEDVPIVDGMLNEEKSVYIIRKNLSPGEIAEAFVALNVQLRVLFTKITELESRRPDEMRKAKTFEEINKELVDLIKKETKLALDELRSKPGE